MINNKILIFLSILNLHLAGNAISITSKDLKSIVENKNLNVAASKLELEAAQSRTGSLVRSFLPSIEVYGSHESFKKGPADKKTEPAYGAEAKINIYNGGADLKENKVRHLELEKKKFEYSKSLASELEKTRTTYWNILYLRDKVDLLKSSIEINSRNLKSADVRIKNGVATESDRAEFEMQDVLLKSDLSAAEVKLESHKQNLRLYLGLNENEELNLEEKLAHEHDFENILKHDHADHNFLYKQDEITSEQASLKAEVNQNSWQPKLEAFASFNQYNQRDIELPEARDRKENVIGLRATMSLSQGFESQFEASALKKEAYALKQRANIKKIETENDMHNQINELKQLHNQVHDAEENIRRSQKYYSMTLSDYSRGVKNSPDVLGASEKLYGSKQRYIEIIRDFQINKSRILSQIGK